jgi:hypothetical protein
MLTNDSLGVIPGRPKGEPGISLHNLEIPGSPLTRRPQMRNCASGNDDGHEVSETQH